MTTEQLYTAMRKHAKVKVIKERKRYIVIRVGLDISQVADRHGNVSYELNKNIKEPK